MSDFDKGFFVGGGLFSVFVLLFVLYSGGSIEYVVNKQPTGECSSVEHVDGLKHDYTCDNLPDKYKVVYVAPEWMKIENLDAELKQAREDLNMILNLEIP